MKFCLRHEWATSLALPLIVFLMVIGIVLPASAGEAIYPHYESYTYDFWGAPIPAPQAYLPSGRITGTGMGAGTLSNPQDLIALEESTYILDSGNNRIIEVDLDWNLIRIIDQFDNDGVSDKIRNPQGFFMTEDKTIYIADTGNERIVVLNNDGSLVTILHSPHHDYPDMFEDRFVFRPQKLGVDEVGRIYVIAQDLYDGIMVLDINGSFRGFVGAPKVNPDALDIFWNKIASDEQRLRTQLFLPIEYSNIDVDERGFIYATVAGPSEDEAIKRLNPSGEDIIVRNGFHPMRGDSATGFNSDENNDTRSRFVDITARDNEMYSVLDRQRGRIFTYDNQGNLLYVFGGTGDAMGLFTRAVAITSRNENVIVLDADGRVTTFRPTEYAGLIHSAIDYYHMGLYDESTEMWQEVARLNPNLDVAHTGIGRALFYDEEYEAAMEAYLNGQNRSGYSLAFGEYRQEVIAENFGFIMTGLIVIVVLIVIVSRFKLLTRMKKAIGTRIVESWGESAATVSYLGVPISNESSFKAKFLRVLASLRYSLHVITHPFDGFWDLKHEKRGNVGSATVILIATVLAWVFSRQYTGFIFNTRQVDYLNIIFESATILLPFILWCAVNWALTTLMEGKGTIKDIFIATAFALVPFLIIMVPVTIASNFLAEAEGAFLALLNTISTIWMLFLIFTGTMVTHEYSVPKTVITSIATIAGIAVVIFLGLLFFSLINQVFGFIYNIYLELAFR